MFYFNFSIQFKKKLTAINLFLLLLCSITLLTSCTTGATLRTARVLEQDQLELSAGVSGTQFGSLSPVVIGAYGVKEDAEIEVRYEDGCLAVTPRLQLLKSEISYVDCLTFFELGYTGHCGFQWGPGIMIGKRWDSFEPYLSYRFRHFSSISHRQEHNKRFQKDFSGANDFHYVKLGSRFYFPCFGDCTEQQKSKWFIGFEVGPTIFGSDAVFEWAANIGFNY